MAVCLVVSMNIHLGPLAFAPLSCLALLLGRVSRFSIAGPKLIAPDGARAPVAPGNNRHGGGAQKPPRFEERKKPIPWEDIEPRRDPPSEKSAIRVCWHQRLRLSWLNDFFHKTSQSTNVPSPTLPYPHLAYGTYPTLEWAEKLRSNKSIPGYPAPEINPSVPY